MFTLPFPQRDRANAAFLCASNELARRDQGTGRIQGTRNRTTLETVRRLCAAYHEPAPSDNQGPLEASEASSIETYNDKHTHVGEQGGYNFTDAVEEA